MRFKEICTIKGYEDMPKGYYITDDGRVININGQHTRVMKNTVKSGYEHIPLRSKTAKNKRPDLAIHRVVASAFINNPLRKPIVHHIDENKCNNNISNLMWATYQENSAFYWNKKKLFKNQIAMNIEEQVVERFNQVDIFDIVEQSATN